MLEIIQKAPNEIALTGRFDAAQIQKAKGTFDTFSTSTIIDFSGLEYISSAGLGILLATQKRLKDHGAGLRLVNVSSHIRDILHFSGFDQIFDIA